MLKDFKKLKVCQLDLNRIHYASHLYTEALAELVQTNQDLREQIQQLEGENAEVQVLQERLQAVEAELEGKRGAVTVKFFEHLQ